MDNFAEKYCFFPIPAKNACSFYLENKRLSGWLKDFTCIAKPAALDCSTLHFSLEFSVQPAVLLHPVETKNLLLWCLDCLQFWGNWAFSGKREDKQHAKMEKCVSLFTNYKDVPCMKSRGMEVVEVVLYYAKEFLYFFFIFVLYKRIFQNEVFWGTPSLLLKGQNELFLVWQNHLMAKKPKCMQF